MATPKKTSNKPTPKIITDEIEVNFVVVFDKDGKYEVREIEEDDDVQSFVRDQFYLNAVSYKVCRVYLTPPAPEQPLILVPQVG